MKEWFLKALEEMPQRQGESDADYVRRLIDATPEKFHGKWGPKTYSNRLYESRRAL
jgi:hypothetical protein